MPNFRCRDLVAHDPVHERSEVAQQVPLAERQRHHEARVEPDPLEDDVVRHEVADEVLLALGRRDVEGLLRHATDERDLELLFPCHRRDVGVRGVGLLAVDRERLEDVLERHAVVGLLPHLLREVEVRLGRVDVRVDAERERLVDEQLVRVEVRHQERDGVTLFVGHLLEVGDVLAELDLVREPGVRDGLVVQVHRPLVADGLEQQAFRDACSEDAHYWQLSHCRSSMGSTGTSYDRSDLIHFSPPNPRRAGACVAADVTAPSSTAGFTAEASISSLLFTLTVDCSAV